MKLLHLDSSILGDHSASRALSAAVVVAWFGRGWLETLAAVLPGGGDALGWSGIAALCLLGNWGFGALRRQFERGPHAAA